MHLPAIRKGLRRLRVAIAAAGAAGVLFAGPAAAADTISVSPATVHTGDTVVISGRLPTIGRASCPDEDNATLASTSALFPAMRISRSADGAFRVHFRVPRSARAGLYRIGARCRGRGKCAQASLRVVAIRVTHVRPSVSNAGPVPPPAPANRDRWWVTAGTLLIGVSVFLGIAEWKPWRRRRG
jgi:hypothetical protein